MKLYYAPGACSLAPHIAANEAGVAVDLVKVDLTTHKTEQGEDFYAINPRGYVPALVFDDGELLTEAQVILQAIADMKPASGLMPPAGTRERLRAQSWLAYISTELHKGFGPLWYGKKIGDTAVNFAKESLAKKFSELDERLGDRAFLTGDKFAAPDAYAFTIVNWTRFHRIDLDPYPRLADYQKRVSERPAVAQALKDEGIG
jgi:glutathione S-transferase